MQLTKITAIGGILGAMAMLIGDLLLYAHWGEIRSLDALIESRIPFRTSILLASERQLDGSALLGGLAVVGYTLGALHIFQKFKPDWKRWGFATASMFALATLLGGIYHALWSMYGKALQIGMTDPTLYATLLDKLENTLSFVNTAATIPLMASSLALITAIIGGKTSYPRFLAVFTPLPLILITGVLLTPLAEVADSPYNSLIKGTNFNIIMMVFFGSSLLHSVASDRKRSTVSVTLRNKQRSGTQS